MWEIYIKGFHDFLLLEKSLSENSILAYLNDVEKLKSYCLDQEYEDIHKIRLDDLERFIIALAQLGISPYSQARIISGIKAFFNYLIEEEVITENPSELLESPKLQRKIPDVLSIKDIDTILSSIDLSLPHGTRNRAIIETLYACGLRASELTELKLSNYFPDQKFVKVIGKNDKERLVPIGSDAIKYIDMYVDYDRKQIKVQKGYEDYVFLNRRGRNLTRNMVYVIVKSSVEASGLKKKVSPHTFRHSFATHLVEGGANLRAVQDMLGHESITTTEIYTHLDKEFLRNTIEKFHPKGSV